MHGWKRQSGWMVFLVLASACSVIRQENSAPDPPRLLHARCATAGVVGLAWAAQGPRISGYQVYRDGAALAATAASAYSDVSVSATTHYDYGVTAVDTSGRASAPASLSVTTAAASPQGDAAYCPSAAIESITWHWDQGYSEANGSDLWPATWGQDGRVYLMFGDGGGFGGSDSLGRTSFGIAAIAGRPLDRQPLLGSLSFSNLYGGYDARHPARLRGKASAIIAVGRSFYALGGIYGESDSVQDYPHLPSGSPNRVQLAYSIGNAYSWRAAGWSFCGADATGKRDLEGTFCPSSFVNFGPGNTGAPGGYVYVLGTINSVLNWGSGIAPLPVNTYLARVPQDRLLDHAAYRYFAGLDRHGHPVWSADEQRMQPVFSDRNVARSGCGGVCNMADALSEVVYDAGLKRYIGIAQGDFLAQTAFYDAPTMWGPWTSIAYYNIDADTGSGGWAHLGTAAGESLGLHPVNAWTSADGKTLWLTYSSSGRAPKDALFPPAGTAMDSFNLVSASLNLADPQ